MLLFLKLNRLYIKQLAILTTVYSENPTIEWEFLNFCIAYSLSS